MRLNYKTCPQNNTKSLKTTTSVSGSSGRSLLTIKVKFTQKFVIKLRAEALHASNFQHFYHIIDGKKKLPNEG